MGHVLLLIMNTKTIVVVTKSQKKIDAIKALFADTPYKIMSTNDVRIEMPPFEVSGKLKDYVDRQAQYVFDQLPKKSWVIAEGTGLFISSLDGKPGIHMSTWAGDGVQGEEITMYTLNRLKLIHRDRSAIFLTSITIISPRGRRFQQRGEISGLIVPEDQKQPAFPNSPYSGIFQPHGYAAVLSGLTQREQKEVSHRVIAYQNTRKFFDTVKR